MFASYMYWVKCCCLSSWSKMDVPACRFLSHGGQFTESNPVARYFISGWGVTGMVYFKIGMVFIICGLSWLIAQQKPQVARCLLGGATALVAFVVIYSLMLLLRHGGMIVEDFVVVEWSRRVLFAA